MSKLIIYAPNVHTGGGKTLLIGLLKKCDNDAILILDNRLDHSALEGKNIIAKVTASFQSRLKAEFILKKASTEDHKVLCFHSLPPIFKSKSKVYVYFHNKHLISNNKIGFPREKKRAIARIWIEKKMSKFFYKNVDEYFVQSNTMKRNLEFYYSKHMRKVTIFPFSDLSIFSNQASLLTNDNLSNSINCSKHDFIYISNGPKHKNHKTLLKAWVVLANQKIFPKLTLTLPIDNKEEIDNINNLIETYHIRVENLGYIDLSEVLKLYLSAKALIFPSLIESYGLPLVEARLVGLPILAPELVYVREVCNPVETFDPTSEISIAMAVKRFLDISNENFKDYHVNDFIDYISK